MKLAASICMVLAGSAATAQQVGPGVEEVVVTATKRGATLLEDTPLSVQSLGGSSLEEAGSLDFDDYMRQVPSLAIGDNGPGDKRIVMRGVSATGDGTVGLYFDEVVMTGESLGDDGGKQPDIKLFDMDRIEVLRGPQGTTFGSSSLSGTIRWLPQRAGLHEVLCGRRRKDSNAAGIRRHRLPVRCNGQHSIGRSSRDSGCRIASRDPRLHRQPLRR